MPWIYIPKKEDNHKCKVPMGWFKPYGSKWECPICSTLFVKRADMCGGSFMQRRDR